MYPALHLKRPWDFFHNYLQLRVDVLDVENIFPVEVEHLEPISSKETAPGVQDPQLQSLASSTADLDT